MSILSIAKIISRGLKSKNLFAMKKVGNDVIILFHNPKSGNSVIKSINTELGQISTYGYKGSRRVLSLSNKPISLVEDIGYDTLKAHPQALALTRTPDKAIVESVNPLLRYKEVASNGKVTEYDDFFGTWVKGNTKNQSMDEFVDRHPFVD